MSKIDQARAAGYSEEEIQQFLAPKIEEAQRSGYTPEEIHKYLGIKPVDHAASNNALAQLLNKELTDINEGRKRPGALEQMGQTVKDAATVYAPVEGALNLASGAVLGFPAYLLGGIGGLAAHYTYSPDTDPKEIAKLFAETFTYNPMTEAGKRFTGTLTSPLHALMEYSEKKGKETALATDSPLLGALTESTISMLPAFLLGPLARKLRGETPTPSDVYMTGRDIALLREHFTHPYERMEVPPSAVKQIAARVQEVYERTGVDPKTLRDMAMEDPTVHADMMSTNLPVPRALGGSGMPPPPPAPRVSHALPEPSDAQKAVMSRISIGEQLDRQVTWERIYTAAKDDLYPIKVIEDALRKGDTPLEVAESPYHLARLIRGAAGKAAQFLEHGTFDFNTYKTTGRGLKQILEPHNKDLDGFRAYMVAKRAEELHRRGIETGVDPDAAAQVVRSGSAYERAFKELQDYQNSLTKYMKDSGLIGEEAFAAMLEANKDYVPFFRVFEGKDRARSPGAGLRTRNPLMKIKGSERQIIDPLESLIKNTYVFTALAERNIVGRSLGAMVKDNPAMAEALGIKNVPQPIRPIKLEASEIRKMFDEFVKTEERTTTQRRSSTTTSSSAEPQDVIFTRNKQRVMDALTARGFSENEAAIMINRLRSKETTPADRVETLTQEVVNTERVSVLDINLDSDAALVFRPGSMNPGPNQIRYFENGKPKVMEVPKEVAEAFMATDKESANALLQILAFPARTLRAGAILTPDFMLRNVARDQLTAFAFSENGYIPIFDMMRGMMSIVKKDAAYQDWLKSGGANSALVALDRGYLQQHLKNLNADAGLLQRGWNVVSSPIEVLRITSELMENATRLGDFKRAGAKTKQEIQAAGFASREVTLDFQRIGAQARAVNMLAAFMNASFEGLDRTVRAFKDHPMRTTARVAASITLPSVLLWTANNSTPERQQRYREIPHWQRDLFWIVMTDDTAYRIPKPFELGVVFGSGPERLLDKFIGDDPKAMKDYANSVLGMMAFNVFPTGAVPVIEQMSNHSFFTSNPLIPTRLESLLPEYQYHEYTTETSRAIGRLIGAFPGLKESSMASPIVIDNYIQAWTGGLGKYVRDALDISLRKAGKLPDPPQPLKTLADIPVIRAFVVRYPSATAQSVADFYESYISRRKTYQTYLYLLDRGDADAAKREQELRPEAFAQLEGIHETIGSLNGIIRMVHRSPDMSPSDKRQLIDTLYGQIILFARAGNKAMEEIDKVLAK